MRGLALTLVVVSACASSRPPGGDGDDDEADAATETESDAATETEPDASAVAPCTPGNLETVAAWPKETGGLHTAPSIAVGPGGELVAAYNVDAGPVMAATRGPGGVWTATPIDGIVGSFPSIAFAPDGTLHACYVRARSDAVGPLVCASRPPGGAWSAGTTVDANVSRYPSVAVDRFGRLGVAYARAEGVAIASQSSGGGWSTYVMSGGTAEGASLAYDAQGAEVVAWTMWSAGSPSLFERATGFVDGTFAWVRPRSLAIDGHGRVHVGFGRYRNEQLSYAYRDADNVWHFEHDLDGDGLIAPWSMALALGAVGKVHVTYTERAMGQTPERVRHAVRSFGTWTTETLYEAPADYFSTTATAASPDGGIHVVFDALPAATPDLRTVYYARRCESVDPL